MWQFKIHSCIKEWKGREVKGREGVAVPDARVPAARAPETEPGKEAERGHW